MSVYRRNDQRSRERDVQRLIWLEHQGHENAKGATTASNWPKTCARIRAQHWLENLDACDDVVEIGHNQIRDPERTLLRTSPEMDVVDRYARLAEEGLAGQDNLDHVGLAARRHFGSAKSA